MFLFRQNYTSNSSKNKKGKMKQKQVNRQNIHAAQSHHARWSFLKQDSTSRSCVVYWRLPPQLQQISTKEGKQISFWFTLITIQPVNYSATIQCNLSIVSLKIGLNCAWKSFDMEKALQICKVTMLTDLEKLCSGGSCGEPPPFRQTINLNFKSSSHSLYFSREYNLSIMISLINF